ncbi:jacalin-related lectin 3 [Syzygium oleosum]|uniref:jacalin-related lectin 3 n=1 Tax=Syzygium oleosum TaxID=219896 RepID=UPI0024BB7672|nr:jacalin-related lectin 3 [Syzygium oleosum]
MSLEGSGKKTVSVGPWGGQDGFRWDDGVYSTVRQLVIAHGSGIDSIQFEYDMKGNSIWTEKHGGNGGCKVDRVKLDYPDEFLTSVHGHYGKLNEWGPVLVRSLTFVSNRKTYGPYGVEQGTYFSFPATSGKIVGFHGKAGWYLDAIGVYLKPYQKEKSSGTLVHTQTGVGNGNNKVGYSVVQGSIGQNFDIVLAVRQKEVQGNCFPTKFSRQSSSSHESSSDDEAKEKMPEVQNVPRIIEGLLTVGPWGGSGGSAYDDGIYTGIRQINLSRNVAIVSIKVLYDWNGEALWGSKRGGTGGYRSDKIVFDYPDEVLTHITGTCGPLMYMGPSIIRSITFHTNRGKHGPFGEEQGPSFTSKSKEGKIVGFHGRSGLFIDAIGIHMIEGKVPAAALPRANKNYKTEADLAEVEYPQWSNKLVHVKQRPAEEVACGIIKEPAPCGPGPWGGEYGRPWDDGVFSGIRQIILTRTEAICSIQIEYDRNGQSVWSVKHGGNGGLTTHRIKLEHPNEVLICISGYYGPISKDERPQPQFIRSLTFHTSRGRFGPFGEEVGTFFTSTTTEGKVVGFHGRSSLYLDAIGVHMQHWLGHQKTARSSLMRMFY